MTLSFTLQSRSVLGACLLTLTAIAPAANIVWSNAATGAWTDGTNWTGGVVPAGTSATVDVAQMNNGGTATISPGDNITVGTVTIGAAATASGNVQMTGGTITSLSTFAVGGTGNASTMTMSAGNLNVNTSDFRIGGNGTNSVGTFTLSNGAVTVSAGNVNLGFGPAAASTASGTMNMSSGSLLVQNATAIMAVGNRGTGTVNQTGGSVELRSASVLSSVNLGRNNATLSASGTYALSAGSLTAARLQYGNNNTAGFNGGTKDFTLSGTGQLNTNTIYVVSTASSNQFIWTGGTLSVGGAFVPAVASLTVGAVSGNVNMSLTNNGGNLKPADNTFSATGMSADLTGTLTFGDGSSYTQNSGSLFIDIEGDTSHDVITLGLGAPVGNATIGGNIIVSLLSGYDPAPGTFFDVVFADTVTNTAALSGITPSGNIFQASEVIAGDGREVLRLTVVVPEPSALCLLALGFAGSFWRRRQ